MRIERATAVPDIQATGRVFTPRPVPDFTINIRSRSGDRLQITATRWGSKIITGEGIVSARHIGRALETMLRLATP